MSMPVISISMKRMWIFLRRILPVIDDILSESDVAVTDSSITEIYTTKKQI